MRHPMIAALLGLMGKAAVAVQAAAGSAFAPRGTSSRRGREGSCVHNPSAEHRPMRQSDNPRDVNLRGYVGAKMARKAKAKTLGLLHGTSAHMKWGQA